MLQEIVKTVNASVSYVVVMAISIVLGFCPPWWKRKSIACPHHRGVRDIPGPLTLPLLGTRWVFTFGSHSFNKIHEFYQQAYKKYGPIVREEALFNVPVINVFEKEDIEKVLRSTGKYPLRPPSEAIAAYRRSRPDRYASTGLVNEQGPVWYHLRTSLTSGLTSPKTILDFLPQVEEIADDWCNLIRLQRHENNEILNLEDIMRRLGLETSCALVLGKRMGFLLPGDQSDYSRKLAEAINQHFIATRDTYFGLPIWKFYKTSAYKKLVESEDTIYQLVLELIEAAEDSPQESIVFQSVLNADIDTKEKTAAIIDFIAAGIHTLKNSLMFLFYLIAKHEDVQQKILDDPTKAYLRACISESFRVLPTANCLARITDADLTLSGYRVNAGSVLVCHTGIACKNDRYFVDAAQFRPDRWLGGEKSATSSSATYLVTPFGAGRRICPGKRFVEQVVPVILESTLRRFEMRAARPMELQFEFLVAPKGPTSMFFKDRV